jgi:hypothetical protein
MKAGFIIVGVMKSGTTTLAHHLTGQREIIIPENEVHYFDYDQNYLKGDSWYESQFDFREANENFIAGEKTPYSFYPYTAGRIHKYDPAMKLIWIFRNPVDRAYSNYSHDLYNIDEWRSFEKCIRQEEKREVLYQYLSKGRYIDQVENFLTYFPVEQMRFVLFEDLLKDPRKELSELFRFLGKDPADFILKEDLHSKKSKFPAYSPAFIYFYKKYIGHKGRAWNFIWRKYFSSPSKQKMKPETRKELLDYYRPFNARLAQLTGKDLNSWNH